MKKLSWLAALIFIFSCNNSGENKNKAGGDPSAKNSTSITATNTSSGCGNALLFHEGVIIESKTYSASGTQAMHSVARVAKVFEEGGMTVAQMESKTSNADGSDEKITNMAYKCDGQNLLMDLSSFLGGGKENLTIEGSGFSFPMNIAEGQTLPEVNYSISMQQAGKKMKITSFMKDRKVIGKETITIPGGTFTCYKISSIIEASTEMEGMDEATKKIMEQMKSKMPKNTMVLWYAPDATVMKMEFYQGDKMVTRNEVTSITK